jgi:hypothetical protein
MPGRPCGAVPLFGAAPPVRAAIGGWSSSGPLGGGIFRSFDGDHGNPSNPGLANLDAWAVLANDTRSILSTAPRLKDTRRPIH